MTSALLNGTSADWTDVLTTGVIITEDITDLDPGTPYHWRVRLLYKPGNALGQPSGRWVTIPVNGWNETDLRTANEPPVADAGPDQIVHTLTVVTLDGSGSFDPDGHLPLTYAWTQTGGTTVTLSDSTVVNPTFTAPAASDTLTFSLMVTDNLGLPALGADEVVITVSIPPPPTADFSGDPLIGFAPLQVQFTDESTGSPTGWAWYFGDEDFLDPWVQQTASAEWTARYDHTSVVMPDGSIVLMGGNDGSTGMMCGVQQTRVPHGFR